ncbi:hypothetical protein EDB19DRAFT_454777 [Suillus lakei]|nr:hypothetical protein EDB19DRAFT_454777 [Suillus lakei]
MGVNTDVSSVPCRDCFVSSACSLPSPTDDTTDSCSDQEVVHTTGEQTDPVLLERILVEDPMIRGAIIFHAYDHLGVLVDLQKDCVIDAGDRKKLAAFRRYIQLALDPMNMSPPPHVCIYQEMVIVASVLKPWKYIEDGTPNRRSIMTEYAPEIVALYENVSTPITPPPVSSFRKSLEFVRQLAKTNLIKIDAENTIEYGIDGLPATKNHPFSFHPPHTTSKIDIHKSSDDIVHQHPTVISLASSAVAAATSSFRKRAKMYLARCLTMVNMARTYRKASALLPSSGPLPMETILLTDSTSILGANLLVELLSCETTKKVYALVAKDASGDSFTERQSKILKKFGFGEDLIHHKKLILVDGDACEGDSVIPQEHFDEVVATITHIIYDP